MNPIVAGIDIETTGFDYNTDEITEIAYVIKRWGDPKPLRMQTHILKIDGQVPEHITKLTGITDEHCAKGFDPYTAYSLMVDDFVELDVEYVMAHNGENFDKPFLHAYDKRKTILNDIGRAQMHAWQWLDSKEDIEWTNRSTSLTYLAADHGFLNPFPHAALMDVLTMFRVAETVPFDTILTRARSPWVIVGVQLPYEQRQLPKDRRYRWQDIDGHHFAKTWVKKIKAMDLAKERAEAPFAVEIVHGG